MKPVISFIAPSHRTERWKWFCDNLVTKVPVEIIFITDKYPQPHEVPENPNFRWVFSRVKPAQCFEAAYRMSEGEFIVWTGDDFQYPDYGTDRVLEMYRKLNDYRKIVSFITHQDGDRVDHFLGWQREVNMTTTALISRKAIEEVGGLADINFVCGHWDCDLMLRIRAIGGEVVRCEGANAFEAHNSLHKIEYNFGSSWAMEWALFQKMWSVNGKTVPRTQPFQGYVDKDILYTNQGEPGMWKDKTSPTVSVILPTIRKHLLNRSLDTISRAWTLLPEIVVVADYARPAGLGSNVKFIQEPRQGVINAINRGLKYCTGEYLFLTNDDSTLTPHSIDEMVKFSRENNDEALIGIKVNPSGSVHRYWGRYFAAWIFVHRHLLAKINETEEFFLDPAFHAFYADPDLSMRAYEKNIKVLECPNALVIADMIPAVDDVDNRQKEERYVHDQVEFIRRHRHFGKFQQGDSEMHNIQYLI